jgi:hypothetical protein
MNGENPHNIKHWTTRMTMTVRTDEFTSSDKYKKNIRGLYIE